MKIPKWVALFQKCSSKFWSVSLEYFNEDIGFFYEECKNSYLSSTKEIACCVQLARLQLFNIYLVVLHFENMFPSNFH